MSIAQFCFSYVRNFKAVDSIVVGADNEAQLLENIALLDTPRIPQQILEEARFFFKDVPEQLLIPKKWKL